MKGFLKLKLVLTLSALIMIMAAVAIPLSGSLIRTHAQAPHNQVVIFLQGLNSKLTLDQVRDQTKSGHSAASIVGMGQSQLPSVVRFRPMRSSMSSATWAADQGPGILSCTTARTPLASLL